MNLENRPAARTKCEWSIERSYWDRMSEAAPGEHGATHGTPERCGLARPCTMLTVNGKPRLTKLY